MGRDVRAPLDLVYGSPETTTSVTYDDYAEELEDRLRCEDTWEKRPYDANDTTTCEFGHRGTKQVIGSISTIRGSSPDGRTSGPRSLVART